MKLIAKLTLAWIILCVFLVYASNVKTDLIHLQAKTEKLQYQVDVLTYVILSQPAPQKNENSNENGD